MKSNCLTPVANRGSCPIPVGEAGRIMDAIEAIIKKVGNVAKRWMGKGAETLVTLFASQSVKNDKVEIDRRKGWLKGMFLLGIFPILLVLIISFFWNG